MQNIILTEREVIELMHALSEADVNRRAVRLARKGEGFIYKVGGGMWSAPIGTHEG